MKKIMLILFTTIMIAPAQAGQSKTVYVEIDGKHTAILVKNKDLPSWFPLSDSEHRQKKYLRIGWGDADYYGADKKNVGMALRALFVPTPSVVEISSEDRLTGLPKLYPVTMSRSKFARLVVYFSESFEQGTLGGPEWSRTNNAGAEYYKAEGRYTLFKNCNNWTSKAIDEVTSDMAYRFHFLSSGVERGLRNL
ncbi:MAG: DUF2459 domain-containing protein [Pseudomonadales bacterium]|nr:DUF2459 domain-containing protein [Pseudomonadales bacterium]